MRRNARALPHPHVVMPETQLVPTSTGMNGAISAVEQELALATGRARQLWKNAACEVHPGLQPAGFKLLWTIIHLQGASGHVLAGALDMDKSVISRQVRLLKEWGLVSTREDDTDGRSRILQATPYAIDRVKSVRSRQRGRLLDYLQSHSEEEVLAIAALLRALNEDLSP
jgi:DNA-binding MarR family transcriptional regulator